MVMIDTQPRLMSDALATSTDCATAILNFQQRQVFSRGRTQTYNLKDRLAGSTVVGDAQWHPSVFLEIRHRLDDLAGSTTPVVAAVSGNRRRSSLDSRTLKRSVDSRDTTVKYPGYLLQCLPGPVGIGHRRIALMEITHASIVSGWRENVFHCLPQVEFFKTWDEALTELLEPVEVPW